MLSADRGELARAGVVYPERWQPVGADAHHDLVNLLRPSVDRDAAAHRFSEYLEAQEGKVVLLSCEQLTLWVGEERRPALVSLLRSVQGMMPVRCVWTLRSIDQVFTSLHLRQILLGNPITTPKEYLCRIEDGIAGICALERELGGESIYVKYDPGGAHCAEILERCGVPIPAAERVMGKLLRHPRVNGRLSRKEATAIVHRDVIAARAGVSIERRDLASLFHSGEFGFEDDDLCILLPEGVVRAMHEEALRASRRHGLTPYLDYYGDLDVRDRPPQPLDPDLLSNADLDRLIVGLEGVKGRGSVVS